MSRERIIDLVAEWFNVHPDENGEYDLSSYEWQAGCYHGNKWLSLAEIVDLIESSF